MINLWYWGKKCPLWVWRISIKSLSIWAFKVVMDVCPLARPPAHLLVEWQYPKLLELPCKKNKSWPFCTDMETMYAPNELHQVQSICFTATCVLTFIDSLLYTANTWWEWGAGSVTWTIQSFIMTGELQVWPFRQYQWVSARKTYLQCAYKGDTSFLH